MGTVTESANLLELADLRRARDLIDRAHYDALTRPWREAIGPVHPGDATMEVDAR